MTKFYAFQRVRIKADAFPGSDDAGVHARHRAAAWGGVATVGAVYGCAGEGVGRTRQKQREIER